jgi:hypothetical protein
VGQGRHADGRLPGARQPLELARVAGPRLQGLGKRRIMSPMDWTTPSYDEIKMDAEIGSYQEDGEPVPIAKPEETPVASE